MTKSQKRVIKNVAVRVWQLSRETARCPETIAVSKALNGEAADLAELIGLNRGDLNELAGPEPD